MVIDRICPSSDAPPRLPNAALVALQRRRMSTSTPTPSPEYLAEDMGPALIGTASLFICFSTLFVVLRYYARYLTHTKFSVEDVIIPFAWLAEIGLCITAIGKYELDYTSSSS